MSPIPYYGLLPFGDWGYGYGTGNVAGGESGQHAMSHMAQF
jgi:hypothetical protein